ncbi:MAG: hypothetical protein IJY36_03580 [Coprobacter sp.]|nr:hypothetical protein [Coprobacter sp.]
MKKTLLSAAAVALMLASCQEEVFDTGISQDEVLVSLTATTPDAIAITRSTSANANSAKGALTNVDWAKYDLRYMLEIWSEDGSQLIKDREVEIKESPANATFKLRLTPNRTYKFVLWADVVSEGATTDLHYNTEKLSDIKMSDEGVYDETRDAYFLAQNVTVTDNMQETLTLRRPFGKLRVVTTDLADLKKGTQPEAVKVEYTAPNIASFSAITGALSTTPMVNKVFTADLVADTYKEGHDAEDGKQTLFVDYIFGKEGEQTPVNFTLTAYEDDAMQTVIREYKFDTQIPVQRNYLTTILGNVLTTSTEFIIKIDEAFANEIDGISTALENAFAKGGKVKLVDNLTFTEGKTLEVAAGVEVELDLDGYTLTNAVAGAPSIINNGTLSIKNGTIVNENIEAQKAAAIKNTGILVLDNVNAGSDLNRGAAVQNDGGEVTINGGFFATMDRAHSSNGYAYVFINNSGNMTVNNAEVNGRPNGIFYVGDGEVNVNGGSYIINEGANTWYVVYAGGTSTVNLNSGTYGYKVGSGQIWAGQTSAIYQAANALVYISDDCVINWENTTSAVAVESSELSALADAVATGSNVILKSNVSGEAATQGYSANNVAGVVVDGIVLDGRNNTITVSGADATYDCSVFAKAGTLKNVNLVGGFKGVQVVASENVTLDNVVIGAGSGITYPLNICGGGADKTVTIKNSTLCGWSSWSVVGLVKFENCTFGNGDTFTAPNAYNHGIAPWVNTEFHNCTFTKEYYMDFSKLHYSGEATVKFVNCTVDGVVLTAENCKTLIVGSGEGTWEDYDTYKDSITFE